MLKRGAWLVAHGTDAALVDRQLRKAGTQGAIERFFDRAVVVLYKIEIVATRLPNGVEPVEFVVVDLVIGVTRALGDVGDPGRDIARSLGGLPLTIDPYRQAPSWHDRHLVFRLRGDGVGAD